MHSSCTLYVFKEGDNEGEGRWEGEKGRGMWRLQIDIWVECDMICHKDSLQSIGETLAAVQVVCILDTFG